ncbi:MAG: di-heme oxidoredictase family protein [Gammaproteobacteria bacterium]
MHRRHPALHTSFRATIVLAFVLPAAGNGAPPQTPIGQEVSSYERLENGEEYNLSIGELIARGHAAFEARWTIQQGGGRPGANGVGGRLADPFNPLVFPRNFNRISAPDSNGCAGCHNAPYGLAGGGGDFVTGVFVAAQRFDFATLDHTDAMPLRGAVDESGAFVDARTIGNYRATIGMFGSGFIEMLARQMTTELQALRDGLIPGESVALETKGVSFGMLTRLPSGAWDVSLVEGLPPQSIQTPGPAQPPNLIIRPFHQSGSVVSIRQFTNNAFGHHHGMQPSERFGAGVDADGDGFVDELTRADITAVSIFQATLPVPVQVLPANPQIRRAIEDGARSFEKIGCADCHRPSLPLEDDGWIYTEPNPFNPPGNLQPGDAAPIAVDLTHGDLPGQRLRPIDGIVQVPAFTDLKLHDITAGPLDPNVEPLDINQAPGTAAFFAGNRRFLTKKLWGAANEPPYFHHGLFTTLREATLAHDGEALASRLAFEHLTSDERDRVIEFLKSLQVPSPRPAP